MAIDGAFLHAMCEELQSLVLARVDKIHQPSKEELVFSLRNQDGVQKLYLSARVNSPRVQLTSVSLENPSTPPMFCMLLRKRLTGARVAAIRQPGLERVLYFDFDCYNELGDPVRLTLAAEIMGRYSNLILIDENGRIADAIKRVDLTMSPMRPLLPGVEYAMPPISYDRMDVSAYTAQEITQKVIEIGGPIDKALLACTQGLSPLVCREIAYRTLQGETADTLTAVQQERLCQVITTVQERILTPHQSTPYIVYRQDGTPLDYSYLPITQYGLDASGREVGSFSQLLDDFYGEKDAVERMRQRSQDVLRVLTNATDRLNRKIAQQRKELETSEKREEKRLYGDIIQANIHAIPRGADHADLINYYDEQCATIRVPLDPTISAVQNAQKYYKAYRKAKTAEEVLTQQIAIGEEELRYLDTVFDALTRATTFREVEELREELAQSGYLHVQQTKKKAAAPTKPLEFISQDGFTILVGRNNVQNDRLTTKTAKGSDWWFHTKNIAGSHTVILCDGITPPETTMMEAAILAATHSKAADSSQVPVDYTQIKFVKKPAGAKPGMVIYETNRTVFVTPDKALSEQLKKR